MARRPKALGHRVACPYGDFFTRSKGRDVWATRPQKGGHKGRPYNLIFSHLHCGRDGRATDFRIQDTKFCMTS